MVRSFKDLVVWQRAMELSLAIYKVTALYPNSERFGLVHQLRRASMSVASNIAEGYGRNSKGEYLQFLGHARGSAFEVQTQLAIGEALGFADRALHRKADALADEVGKMLISMMNKPPASRKHAAA